MRFPASIALSLSALMVAFSPAPVSAADVARVQGVPVLLRTVEAAVPILKERGVDIKVIGEGGRSQTMAALGTGQIELGLIAKPVTSEERATYPARQLEEYQVGTQAVGLLVSRGVWESGVKALRREQVEKLYEGRIKNWKELGGEDRAVKFYEMKHGNGVWEMLATWLYGDTRKAPGVPWNTVTDGSDAQSAVQFDSGGMTAAAFRWADNRDVFALSIIDDAGNAIAPTPENVAAGKYPMSRPVYIVAGDRPAGDKKKLIEFLLSEEGQALVAKGELLPLLKPAAAEEK